MVTALEESLVAALIETSAEGKAALAGFGVCFCLFPPLVLSYVCIQ